jgi:hypothetical protein
MTAMLCKKPNCMFLMQNIIDAIDWCLTPTLAVFQLYRGFVS